MATIKLRYEYFSLAGIFVCLFLIFRFPIAIKDGVTQGLNFCFYTIIPSLFPFMTLSSYITKSDIFSSVYKFLNTPFRIFFRQPPCSASVIILSMISGFPVGIKMTDELYKNGQLTQNQAQRLCIFCMNAGPAFVISVVGTNMLDSTKAGVIIYFSLCLSAFIIGIISSFFAPKTETSDNSKIHTFSQASLSIAVSDSLQAVMGICAWVVLFNAFINCLNNLNLSEKAYIIISSVSEITNGCMLLCGKSPLPIITGMIGFGGICVHCQVLANVRNMKIKYGYFFLGRVIHGIMASLISFLLFHIFPVETNVFSSFNKITDFRFSVSIPAFIVFIFMCIIMIFDIDRKRKV